MMNTLIDKINNWGLIVEQKSGLFFTSIIVALVFSAIAMLYVSPSFELSYLGIDYSELSKNPFDFSIQSSVRYRILAPFLGYLTFLRGDLFFVIPLLFSFLILAAIYYTYRKKNFNFLESSLQVGVIAFSCTLFIPLVAAGYTDCITYFFIFLSFSFIRKPMQSAFCFGLALLNHESAIFMLPALMVYKNYVSEKRILSFDRRLLVYVWACLPYVVYRYSVSTQTNVEYDFSFYFSKDIINANLHKISPLFPAGLFYTFKLFWIFPIWIIYKSIKARNYGLLFLIVLIIFSAICQLVVAVDVSRLLCLLFPAILLSVEELRRELKSYTFIKICVTIIILNFFVTQYFASSDSLNLISRFSFIHF